MTTGERERFYSWWRASKYCQVVNPGPGDEQRAWDAWQAAIAARADPASFAWKSGYAQAREEMETERAAIAAQPEHRGCKWCGRPNCFSEDANCAAQPERAREPVAWICVHPDTGGVHHYGTADGWELQIVSAAPIATLPDGGPNAL